MDEVGLTPRDRKRLEHLKYRPSYLETLKQFIMSTVSESKEVTANKICKRFRIDTHILESWMEADAEFAKIVNIYYRPVKPLGLAYDENVHPEIALTQMSKGLRKSSICSAIGVSGFVVDEWLKKYPSFRESYELGIEKGKNTLNKILLTQAHNGNYQAAKELMGHERERLTHNITKDSTSKEVLDHMLIQSLDLCDSDNFVDTVPKIIQVVGKSAELVTFDEINRKIDEVLHGRDTDN